MNTSYPKISIVTPVYNQVEFIEETILSVIQQDYPNLEYIIIDGGSTDGTLDVIKQYEKYFAKWISEPDNGMYDALNKGFGLSTGEIMGWINADDILLKNALSTISKVFTDVGKANWIQGISSYIDSQTRIVHTILPKRFSLLMFLNKDYKWIQQESTFWKRSLWDEAGGNINENLKLAGDFDLWFRFSQHSILYNCMIPIGAWRKRKGQLSSVYQDDYIAEIEEILSGITPTKNQRRVLKKIKVLTKCITFLEVFKIFNTNFLKTKRIKYYDVFENEIFFSQIDAVFKTIY